MFGVLEALNSISPARRAGLLNRRDYNGGSTVLHEAAFRAKDSDNNTVRIISLLLEAGADATLEDGQGRRPLMVAVADGHIKAVQVCLCSTVSECRPRMRLPCSVYVCLLARCQPAARC